MTKTVRPLVEYLAEVGDPRKAQGLRHPLVAILCLCCVALMSGAKNPKAIANWWKNRKDMGPFLQRLGFTRSYGPSPATWYWVLSRVPIQVLEAKFQQWAEENLGHVPAASGELEGVAVDGKTLRGSRKQGAEATPMLSALSHRLGLTLGQLAVDDQTNEIGAAPDLLADLILEGRIFTMDAQLTQREIAPTSIDHQGDYVMIVKACPERSRRDNQPTLRADIELLFADPDAATLFVEDRDVMTDKGHGRLEVRILQTSSVLNDYLNWPGVQQVFRLDRKRIILKTGEVQTETAYGITSLAAHRAGAAPLQGLVRGHWSIENRSHWVRDVTFGEDHSQVRNGHLPQVMAALRNCVIGLLRLRHFRWIPDAFDYFAAHPFKALATIGC
jgi:predicted transposase YbfD/YdcC